MVKSINKSSYKILKADIAAIISEAREQVKDILLRSYWTIGERIAEDPSATNDAHGLCTSLAEDLDLDRSVISRSLELYRTFPHGAPCDTYPALSWTHYRLILPIKDEAVRMQVLKKCNKGKWNVRTLKFKIHELQAKTLSADPDTEASLTRRSDALHVYRGVCERVIDGDTLLVAIDLGFDVWVKQRIRLRGINCPERGSDAGTRATAFVEERIVSGTTLIIQTFAIDIHGRYVADIFYLNGETNKEKIFRDGRFLNQEILDAGLALRV